MARPECSSQEDAHGLICFAACGLWLHCRALCVTAVSTSMLCWAMSSTVRSQLTLKPLYTVTSCAL